MNRIFIIAILCALAFSISLRASAPMAHASGCQFLEGGGPAAFCDTLGVASGGGTRAGQLDGRVWGVSRTTGNVGSGYASGWADVTMTGCGNPTVHPEIDVQVCGGQMREALNDNGTRAQIAMYPRQPFDIAGRTGTVVFDVSDDTMGSHTAWPEFAFTDQPVPSPFLDDVGDTMPKNGVDILFAGNQSNNTLVTVDEIFTSTNYVENVVPFTIDGSMNESGYNQFQMNHVEIQLSSTGVVVWGSDAGTTTMHKLAHATFTMPLTRGLVWMKDVHYNAEKDAVPGQNEQSHTFAWANFGFDGPTLTRDLGVELPDNTGIIGTAENGLPLRDTGVMLSAPNGSTTFSFSGSYALGNVEGASNALLELNYYLTQTNVHLTYAANGHPSHTVLAGGGDQTTWGWDTIALPIPPSELVDGSNTITFSADNGGSMPLANVDMILVGAGGPPAATPTPINTPTPTATNTPGPTPTPTNTPIPPRTFGNTSVGSATDSADANWLNGSRFVTGSTAGTVVSMSVHVGAVDAFGNDRYALGIYTDSAGSPGTLVAHSASGMLTANSWNTIAVSATLTANTAYWLVYNTNATSASLNDMHYATGSGTLGFGTSGDTFGTWPTSFGASTTGSGTYSIYATYQ